METNTVQQTDVITPTADALPSAAGVAGSVVPASSLRWGAIFGGAVASLGIAGMLYALGLALGLSWIEPNDPSSLRPTGIFSGIWLVIVSLIALFVGGYVAARGAGALSRGFGALHGLVMWGLSVVAGAWLVGNVASAVVRGGAAVGRAAVGAVSGAMPSGAQLRELPERLGVSANDLLAPVNQRLRAAGSPAVTAQQLESATRDALQRAAREGRLDREVLTQSITDNTALSRADAEQVSQDAENRFQAARTDMKRQLAQASQTALAAAEDSSKAFWVLFGSLLLGMLAAIGGAVVAGDRGQRASTRQPPVRPAVKAARHTAVYP